jgi:hypothetical protein
MPGWSLIILKFIEYLGSSPFIFVAIISGYEKKDEYNI